MKVPALLRKARGIVLVMLAVYLLSFGAGYLAGRRIDFFLRFRYE